MPIVYHHLTTSRYARLGEELIDRCVAVVRDANEVLEAQPIFDATDYILSAREILEAELLLEAKGHDVVVADLSGYRDWTLACMADGLGEASVLLGERGNVAAADEVRARELTLLRRLAESPWCSPLVNYTDAFAAVVADCRHRRDPACLVHQATYLLLDLERMDGANVLDGLRDLGWLHHVLGGHERAVGIFTQLLRHDPGDVWTHNEIAFVFSRAFPRIAHAAAKRGLEVIGEEDVRGIAPQLQRYVDQLDGRPDGRCPANTEALLAALRLSPAGGAPMTLRKLCRSVAPETTKARRKSRGTLPDAEGLRQLREGLRSLPRPAPKPVPLPQPPLPLPRPGAADEGARSSAPTVRSGKVGRNDACLCGSGKKYKRCCAA